MMKRNKAILCALASIGFITSVNTVSASAMTMNTNTTTNYTQYTVSQVVDLIDYLPYSIDIKKVDEVEKQIEKARNAYNSLNVDEQNRVDRYTSNNLKRSEDKLKDVKDNIAKAKDLVTRIDKLKKEVVKGSTRGYNSMFKVDKDKLKANMGEIHEIRRIYDKLDYSVRYGDNNLVTNYEDFVKIECRLAETK